MSPSPPLEAVYLIGEDGLQRGVRAAIQAAGRRNKARRSFATRLLGAGYDIRTVQEPLGHEDIRTTMISNHVLNRGGKGVRRRLDE